MMSVNTLLDLALGTHTYWKFSQTVKGRSVESVFAEYKENTIVVAQDREKGLSFVADSAIVNCYMYGDQLTKLCMDINNPLFAEVKNNPVLHIGFAWDEYETKKLVVEKNYSLREKSTIKLLVSMTPENDNSVWDLWRFGAPGVYGSFSSRLKECGFDESAELIMQLCDLALNKSNFSKEDALIFIDNYKSF